LKVPIIKGDREQRGTKKHQKNLEKDLEERKKALPLQPLKKKANHTSEVIRKRK
jgi:hypothetical protein